MLILHGLAGTSHEWDESASWLAPDFRVVVPDQRGHGGSARAKGGYSLEEYAGDAIELLDAFARSAALVGHSFGGQVAILAAARRPASVSALVVVEAGVGPSNGNAQAVAEWLARWPSLFPDLTAARAFFGSMGLSSRWADGLVRTPGGYRPAFVAEDMIESARSQEEVDLTGVWRDLSVPILVVQAENGFLGDDEPQTMLDAQPLAHRAVVPGSGHDVHLDRPAAWRDTVESFLRGELLTSR